MEAWAFGLSEFVDLCSTCGSMVMPFSGNLWVDAVAIVHGILLNALGMLEYGIQDE